MSLRARLGAIGGGVLVLAPMPFVLPDFLLSLTLSCLMYGGLAVSWAMFSGATNYLSLATAAFFGLGAYVTAWGVATLPWPLVVIGGGLVAAAFAAVVGGAILHLRGPYFAVLTFGLGELVARYTYVEKASSHGPVSHGGAGCTTVYVTVLLGRRGGGGERAVASSLRTRARRHRPRTRARADSRLRHAPMNCGLHAAAFFRRARAAVAVRWTSSSVAVSTRSSLQTVLIAMARGRRSGPLASAVVFSLLTEFLRLRFPYAYLILLGTLLIVLVIYVPGGLASLFARRRARVDRVPEPARG